MFDGVQRSTFRIYSQDFIIDRRFRLVRGIGHGTYGSICSAVSVEEGDNSMVAIKKLSNVCSSNALFKRALRELKLLKHFKGHSNIAYLHGADLVIMPDGIFNGLYLYQELMECDLQQIFNSKQQLTDRHFQSFIHQLLCGLKYIHSADVLLRNLKPSNILVNSDCQLRICDFGYARGLSVNTIASSQYLAENISSGWYRAPELILNQHVYSTGVDIWSTGCILAQFLAGEPLFKGNGFIDQLNCIIQVLGSPPEKTLHKIASPSVQQYIRNLGSISRIPFSKRLPKSNPESLDLLEKMLQFDPADRITVDDALHHTYLGACYTKEDDQVCSSKMDFSFEKISNDEELRQLLLEEVMDCSQIIQEQLLDSEIAQNIDFEANEKSFNALLVDGLVAPNTPLAPPKSDKESNSKYIASGTNNNTEAIPLRETASYINIQSGYPPS